LIKKLIGLKVTKKIDYVQSIEALKYFLMPFVCFWAFGFPEPTGIVELVSGFVVPTYFVLSGFCVLGTEEAERREKLRRVILRSAILFAALLVIYVLINLLYPLMPLMFDWGTLRSKRVWFNFLVLNVWPLPIGDSIWFIQAMLYAYVILWIADRLKLLRFYKPVMVVLFVVMILSGELSGVIGFNMLGYTFIPGGAITRALPYLLLGMLIREKEETLCNVPAWVYAVILVIGGGMAVGEVYALSQAGKLVYLGHMLGYGVMAFATCGLALAWEDMGPNPFSFHGGTHAKRIYAWHNPVYYLLVYCVMRFRPQSMDAVAIYGSIIVFLLCWLVSIAYSFAKRILWIIFTEKDEDEDIYG